MGIPIGWNIVRDEAQEKDVLRADVTGARSVIRRRPRGSRVLRRMSAFDAPDGYSTRFAQVLDHAPLSHARTQLPPPAPPVPELREHDLHVHELPTLTPGFAPAGPRSPSPYAADEEAPTADGPPPRGVPPQNVSGRRIELDDFVDGPPPPVPDGVSWAFERRHAPARRRDSNPTTMDGIISWTFSPRHAPYTRPARRHDSNPAVSDDEDVPSAPSAVAHPPLRRVGRRRIADGPLPASSLRESWSPGSTVDGLGDRERSNSVSSTASALPWQPFLTTVVPDPVPPTAESSFASSAASASFAASSSRASSSNSNSAASEHTQVTIPSRRGDQMSESFARACESSDEGESTASDTDDEATANPLSRRRLRPSYFADAPPSPRRYGRSVTDQGIDARRYVRSYYSDVTPHSLLWDLDRSRSAQVDGPVDDSTPNERDPEGDSFTTVADDDADQRTVPASPLDQELRDVRSVIERLARRGDISDDFWASVGLTRRLADGVQRVQDRGRF